MLLKEFIKRYEKSENKTILTKKIYYIDENLGLLGINTNELEFLFPEIKGANPNEVVSFIQNLYDKCDASSPNYDIDTAIKISRYTLATDKIYTNKREFQENNEVFGTTLGDRYDDLVDSENERSR